MSNLVQQPNSVTFYKGWYGRCDKDECEEFKLSTIKSKILYVYQTSELNDGYVVYRGDFPDSFNVFTTLECGKSYIIILKPGNDTVTIPHYTTSTSGSGDFGRIFNQCLPSTTPTPTVTATPSVTPTITLTPTPTPTEGTIAPSPTTTPTPTPTPTNRSDCAGYQHTLPGGSSVAVGGVRVQGVATTATVCHNGATGGAQSNTLLQLKDTSEFVGVLVINGALPGSIKYNHTNGTSYIGSVTIGSAVTVLEII